MSIYLIVLSGLILGLGAVPFFRPRSIFDYPFVVGMFLSVWFLPQAWNVERLGLAGAFDPTLAWRYIILCIVFLVGGYLLGRGMNLQQAKTNQAEISAMYSEKRMSQASAGLIAVGAVAYFMMSRLAATDEYGAGWNGIIIVYATLAQCLVFGAALTFLIYLRTKDKFSLVLFFIATAVFAPVLFVSIKREFIFEFCVIVFGSLFLVRNIVPSRLILIAGCVIGAFIVNNAGDIRGYVKENDATLVGALTDSDLITQSTTSARDRSAEPAAPEVSGAVTDIAIASEIGDYYPFTSIINGMVSRYFPSFIFGRDAKNALMMKNRDENPLLNRYYANGATRTGFSDTFQDFWYFGVFAFMALGFFYGWTLNLAKIGGLRGQYLYVSMLGTGLHAITHSFAEFAAALPFLWLVVWLPFRYARITPEESKRLMLALHLQGRS
ncbi:MAG: putative rane protein [Sphingomonas bacterium]|uniref:hypothetical protein n=1 Tax=Sphingomonas bacterium TaxID=1895847 RepID=UPI00262E0015|nr:hypothetical protein [Sphingomonas bacterium]MDB5706262.1 putative rane protein [Sphingomonas bacterium]